MKKKKGVYKFTGKFTDGEGKTYFLKNAIVLDLTQGKLKDLIEEALKLKDTLK